MASATSKALGWLGTLPFIIACFYTFSQQTLFGLYPPSIFIAYSAVILAFLSGAMWGQVIADSEHPFSGRLLVISNVFALIALCGLALSHLYLPISISLLGIAFLFIWRIEVVSLGDDEPVIGYFKMRKQLTLVVASLHLLQLVATLW